MTIFSSRRSRVAASLAAVAISALALSACSGGSSDADASASSGGDAAIKKDINVQLSWIKNEEFAGEFFADSKGYYTDAGFDSVTLIPGPTTGAAELISGSADFATSDAVSIGSVVASEGAPLKIIGTTYQKNPFTVLSLADGGNIATVDDLKGKKIGVQDANTALFTAFLAANGLTTDDVEIVPVQYDPAPLTNGEVDGFISYLTNESIIVASEGYDTVNLPFADNGLPFVAETFVTTDDMIANNPETVKAFLIAEIKGWTDAVNDPEEGARLAYEEYGADLDLNPENSIAGATEQVELVVSDETAENGLFTISDDLQAATIESLAGAGIDLEASDLFDLSLLKEVYEENPDLIAYAG
ncbi:ABC-type nitrate/sulfonate/bicarbonate transport system substrate-binding protein [Microbacterium endophyticum]|uniref:Thiamine pyrimidine synthase n=1 Tax=Microbacterium endophyticum TaxID=1526412 RepID=A0A7W4YP11_9MICO|nr:ABC transporter substrate-binding protein [Microbacterium endophyticum]MBB2977124.1 ABC-type nitrate/sulfonate/bicarbonate transport system substrate-binding protein [Microbacterium endophyticum]NIK36052.1 ABC-type nitrate/sulfonate/bicarbonate transport system substrate-binding protein [Microbacterium endophyticum]